MQANGIASAALFSCLLIAASVWDVRKRIIPDAICVTIAAVGLLTFHPTKLFGVLIGMPFLIAALIKEGGMGGGDMKLVTASGFVLGLPVACMGIIIGLVMLLAWYLIAKAVCKAKGLPFLSADFPLAPFLSIGFFGAILLQLGGNQSPMI